MGSLVGAPAGHSFPVAVWHTAGPVLGLLNTDDLFGELLFPLVSLSVAVILFEGSLTLRFSELVGVGSTVRNLVTIGALVTWAITSLLVHKLIGFDYKLSTLSVH